jgi:hypothetical protein
MAYIGNTVQNQGFTPAIDYFNGNGVTVTFTLSRPVVSVAQMIVAIDNVIQNPSTAFTVSGNSITFTSAPLSGSNNIWVEYTSLITQYNAISQDPSVIGDITATGGYLATGDFGNTFTDGTIVDYVTGMSRITTGSATGMTFYNGGPSARNALMALTSAGNVGIGTTSPRAQISFSNATATAGEPNKIRIYDDGSTQAYGIGLSTSQQNYVVAAGGNHCFYVGNLGSATETMRISSGGDLLVGTTANPYGSSARAILVSNATSGSVSLQPSTSTYATRIVNITGSVYFDNNGSNGYVCSNGNASFFAPINASAFNVSSDYRLKENITPLTGAIEKIQNFKPVRFSYKSTNKMSMPWGTDAIDGFLAHEFAEVVPAAVTGQKDAVDENDEIVAQTLDMTKAIPLMVAAIQELKSELDSVKAELATLKGSL